MPGAVAIFPARCAGETNVLAGLRPEHPRLIATAADWQNLPARRQSDAALAALLAKIELQARAELNDSPVVYKKQGRRLLAVSRETLRRELLWSGAFRLTGDRAFAERAEKELLNLGAVSGLEPVAFSRRGGNDGGVCVRLRLALRPAPAGTRAVIRNAILEKGLRPGLRPNGWQARHNNWNQVCFGGLTLGALAIADEEPEMARELLDPARRDNLERPPALRARRHLSRRPGLLGLRHDLPSADDFRAAIRAGHGLGFVRQSGFLDSAAALELCGPAGNAVQFFRQPRRRGFSPRCFGLRTGCISRDFFVFRNHILPACRHAKGQPALPKMPGCRCCHLDRRPRRQFRRPSCR